MLEIGAEKPELENSEAALLAQLRAGDEAAFAMLVSEYGGRLLLVTRRILGNEDDARDALQDAFLSAFRSIDRFAGESKLATWLHRIAVNAALAKLRTQKRKPLRSIDDLLPQFIADGHEANPGVEWRLSGAAAAEQQETCRTVRAAIDQLPELYRTVLVLRDIEDVNTEDAAAMLGVTTNVVKTRLHRARQALRTLLDPHFRGGDA
jgi:RNA polymerase sigma-70 factor, ECF subfamily